MAILAKHAAMRGALFVVLVACGSDDKRPAYVGSALGDTHVSQGPVDPTRPPPDAPEEQPIRSRQITSPQGPAPVPVVPESQQPPPAPPPQPGVFSPPPPPSGPADVPQPEIPKP